MNDIVNEIYYHVCVYPEYELKPGIIYNTEVINRTYDRCEDEKEKLEGKFEEYRQKHCDELPKRSNCFYVCLRNDVEYWEHKLTKTDIPYRPRGSKIFEVKLDGKIFWADANKYEDSQMEEYWMGCSLDDKNATLEGLFIGKYQAIKERHINEFRSH